MMRQRRQPSIRFLETPAKAWCVRASHSSPGDWRQPGVSALHTTYTADSSAGSGRPTKTQECVSSVSVSR